MLRFATVLAFLLSTFTSAHSALAGDNPSAPTGVIYTYSPAFGGPLTTRAAWGEPNNWSDNGATSGTRYYIAQCVVKGTGEIVYNVSVPYGQNLVQFDVPYASTHYSFQVFAVNKFGKIGRPGKYSVIVP